MAKTAAERQKYYRDKKRNAQPDETVTRTVTKQVTPVTDGVTVEAEGSRSITVGLDDYLSRPEAYITRREPEKLNWGPWMDMAGLEQAGLKANRVAIPGDWDYEGAAIFIPGLPLSMPQEAIA